MTTPTTPTSATPAPRGPRLIPVLAALTLGILLVVAVIVARRTTERDAEDRSLPAIATMKADLRNLVSAEESYFAGHATYTDRLSDLAHADGSPYRPSRGAVVRIIGASATGFSATIHCDPDCGLPYHPTTKTCGVFVGRAPPPVAGQLDGEPACP